MSYCHRFTVSSLLSALFIILPQAHPDITSGPLLFFPSTPAASYGQVANSLASSSFALSVSLLSSHVPLMLLILFITPSIPHPLPPGGSLERQHVTLSPHISLFLTGRAGARTPVPWPCAKQSHRHDEWVMQVATVTKQACRMACSVSSISTGIRQNGMSCW